MSLKSTNHSSFTYPIASNQKEPASIDGISNSLSSESPHCRSFRLTFLVFSFSIGAISTACLNSFLGNSAYASELPSTAPILEPVGPVFSTSSAIAAIPAESDALNLTQDVEFENSEFENSEFWADPASSTVTVGFDDEMLLSAGQPSDRQPEADTPDEPDGLANNLPAVESDLPTLDGSAIETVEGSDTPLDSPPASVQQSGEAVVVLDVATDLPLQASNEIASSDPQPTMDGSEELFVAVPQESVESVEELSVAQPAVAQQNAEETEDWSTVSNQASDLIGTPLIDLQGAYILQGDESSARLRATGIYVFNPSMMVGATVDLTTGNAFSDSESEGLNLNELYFTASPEDLPGLRFTVGLLDLTSYFDRNSFAKDSVTHFFNPVFQTNPALSATGIGSRPAFLVNWMVTDHLEIKAATFSSSRDLGEFALDGFAGEIGVRLGNFILRGTYATDRDAGQDDGFREIFQFSRNDGDSYGLLEDDRETSFGLNAELFIPELNLGLFGRYGHYENQDLDSGGDTYSVGLNFLDLFFPDDRLGLAYGRQLSNDELREDEGDEIPDVLELFYDVRLTPHLRAGVTIQQRDGFSETVMGFRVRADVNAAELGRLFR